MKKTKKIVGILIAVILQLSILSNSTFAEENLVTHELDSNDQVQTINVTESNPNDAENASSEELNDIVNEGSEVEVVEEVLLEDEPVKEEIDNKKDIKEKTNKEKKEKKPKEELHAYLKSLSSKDLTKEVSQLTNEELHTYLKEVKGYSDLQINGEIPIINKNGNLFFYKSDRLKPYMATPKDNEKFLKLQQNEKNKLSNAMPQSNQGALLEPQVDVIPVPDESLEIPILRDEHSKFYKLEDGTNQSLFSPIPIHYRDGETFKDISINIENDADSTYEYANRENSFKTFFNSHDSLDNGMISKYVKSNMHGTKRQLEFKISGANPTGETIRENKITYHNVFPHVDVEYLINPVRLKENIYVYEPISEVNYEFLLKLDGVTPRANDALDIEFVDQETNEIIWIMERPYAEDSGINQLTTRDMHYDMETVTLDGEEWLKLVLVMDDPNFLADATYPITIDPTIFPSVSNIRMIIEGSNQGFGYNNEFHMYGFPNGYGQEHRVYMSFDQSSMPRDVIIDAAQLTIYPQGRLGYDVGAYYTVRRVTSSFSSATWYNKASVTTLNQDRRYSSSPADTKVYRIENLMNDAYRDGNFYGIEIAGEAGQTTGFYTDTSHNPQLLVSYTVNQIPQITTCTTSDYYKIPSDRDSWALQIVIVDDAPSHQLKTDLYIDGVKTHANVSGMAPLFSLDIAAMTDGLKTLRFVSTDGTYTAEYTTHIFIDRHSPIVSDVQLTPQETSIDMLVQASDPPYDMPATPYSYGLDGTFDSYISSATHTFTTLTPSTTYNIGLKVKDKSDLVTEKSYEVTTKAMVPAVSVSNIRSTAMNIDITDTNGTETDYVIQVDNQYVASNGTLVSTEEWIRFTGAKTIDLTGLESGQAYTIKAKARNKGFIESVYSSSVTANTIGEVPAVVQGLSVDVVDNTVTLHWDALVDATNYDVEINGEVVQVATNLYAIPTPQMDSSYQVRVRGVNLNGNGLWSDMLDFIPANIINIDSIVDKHYYATWNVKDYTSFANKKFVLLYDASHFEVVDLCAYTYENELVIGLIPGTDVEITSITEGKIEFIMHKSIPALQKYSGAINTIKLKAKLSGESVIQFEVIDVQ